MGFFFERWSKCHGSNLLEQLNAGVRYLDLRVCISHLDDEIRTEHAVYGERIMVMLEHLRTFLENNPEEIVVLFCHKFRAGMDKLEDHDRFLKLVKDVFGEGKAGDIFVKENEFGCSYSELIRKKRRLAFLYGDEEVVRTRGQNWLLSPASCQWDRWYDQPTVEGLKNRIFENRPVIRAAGDDIKLTIAQCILSPTPLMTILGGAISILRFLICNFFAFKRVPQDLMMLAEKANALATRFVSGELGDFKFNVVLLDNVGGGESENLLRSIVGKNVRK
ncbi:hypothetical protein TL16_g12081 [Triparma laevis f. inornata]|uniref:Uncharacterized protein n=1 Tax=Triparma laevis f. inornata TaxID=1714386 RepID=A0A9W7BQF5_9STRA|nr:hypothetical protein TL16_g12081 [Triparma laevis f. inornata]